MAQRMAKMKLGEKVAECNLAQKGAIEKLLSVDHVIEADQL